MMARVVLALWVAGVVPGMAEATRVEVFYSPTTDLETVEVATLNASLGRNVNFAAFVLSDYKVINALARLGQAGATIRIYLDPREVQRMQLHTDHPLVKLARTPNVQVKIKTPKGKLMHLKGYTIGGTLLRTGSANDSVDGLKQQDNDLILIYSREAATRFDAEFERMWSRADNDNLLPH